MTINQRSQRRRRVMVDSRHTKIGEATRARHTVGT